MRERARGVVDLADGGFAEAALRHVDDALEGEVVGAACATTRKIGQRIADFQALVEARAADDAVVEAERDEAVLELAHLEGGAHQDRHVVELVALAAGSCSISSPTARASSSESQAAWTCTLASSGFDAVGEQRLAEPALIVGDEVRGGAEDVRGRAVVALEPDDGGAREILLEAQDVVDLGAAPAIDRLVVVADAADVDFAIRSRAVPRLSVAGLRGGAAHRLGRPVGLAAFGRMRRLSAIEGAIGCAPASGRCASSRSHMYCAVLVS